MRSRFSFEVISALDYDELRPSYAPEAIAWVAERGNLRPGAKVVDLAAGTGQLSRPLAHLCVALVAVEPAANMRALLQKRLPAVHVVDGTAEGIPLTDSSVDAVVVGNAFHHFERRATSPRSRMRSGTTCSTASGDSRPGSPMSCTFRRGASSTS